MASSIEQFGGMNITPVVDHGNVFASFSGGGPELEDAVDYYSTVMAADNPYSGYIGHDVELVRGLIEEDLLAAAVLKNAAPVILARAAELVGAS